MMTGKYWLVVEPYPSEKYDIVRRDDEIPNRWKVIKFHGSKPPTSIFMPEEIEDFHFTTTSRQTKSDQLHEGKFSPFEENHMRHMHLPKVFSPSNYRTFTIFHLWHLLSDDMGVNPRASKRSPTDLPHDWRYPLVNVNKKLWKDPPMFNG